MGFPFPPIMAANPDSDGLMPAAAYRRFAGAPPTDPTDPISTAGASGTYSEATVTNVVSTLTPAITNLTYRRCHDLGHAAARTLVPLMLCPGFGGSGNEFTTATLRRLASYGFLVIVPTTRGRGSVSGALHYAGDTQDALDILAAAVTAATSAGATVLGSGLCAGWLGASTGALDVGLMASRVPEAVLFAVFLYPNHDLGVDPEDGYWGLTSTAVRSSLTTQVGDRAQGAAAAVDPYLALDIHTALPRILALPECGIMAWVGGDETEAPQVPITSPSRLVRDLRAWVGPQARVSWRVTTDADPTDERILHDEGIDSAGVVLFERRWVPRALSASAPWSLPRELSGLRVLGWFRQLEVTGSASAVDDRNGCEIWLGSASPPRSDANGGRAYAADMSATANGAFRLDLATSSSGYAQIMRDSDDNRTTAITAGTPLAVNLNLAPVFADFEEAGFAHDFRADVGVTGSPVTAVADQIGALTFTGTGGADAPTAVTDGDGKAALRFAAASSQKLLLTSLLVDPTADFTICVVASKTNTSAGHLLACSHHGTLAELSIRYSNPSDAEFLVSDSFVNLAEVGNHAWAQNTKVFIALMCKRGVLYSSVGGSNWSKDPIAAGAFTTSGTNTSTVGAGWANSGGVYWQFYQGDVYEWASRDAATSESDLLALYALMRTRWSMP